MFSSQLKKGSMELLILSILDREPRHGYEIGKLIEQRSGMRLRFHISSLYPVLCRMQKKKWIRGRWVEQAGKRRRRYYELTLVGKKALAVEQETWVQFAGAVDQVIGLSHA